MRSPAESCSTGYLRSSPANAGQRCWSPTTSRKRCCSPTAFSYSAADRAGSCTPKSVRWRRCAAASGTTGATAPLRAASCSCSASEFTDVAGSARVGHATSQLGRARSGERQEELLQLLDVECFLAVRFDEALPH